jgi:recombination associated protein RdgC
MLYRNLMLFRFPKQEKHHEFNELLAHCAIAHPLKPVGPMEMRSSGWVSPFGTGETELSNDVGGFIELALGTEERLLPGAVVAGELAKRLEKVREAEGRNPGGRERKRIKDEIITEMLPKAFVKPSVLRGFIDSARGWAVIDTSSRKRAEDWVAKVRETLGSFPAVPVFAESGVRAHFHDWMLYDDHAPEGFTLGEDAELHDLAGGRAIKVREHDLAAEEIREHLRCGLVATKLALDFEGRLSFTLGDDLVIRKLRFHDVVTDRLLDEDRETKRQDAEATLALQAGEIMLLLDRLAEVFALAEVQS